MIEPNGKRDLLQRQWLIMSFCSYFLLGTRIASKTSFGVRLVPKEAKRRFASKENLSEKLERPRTFFIKHLGVLGALVVKN